MAIHIGTSGWSYAHWKENFYPKGVKEKEWLQFFSSVFQTVEINSTFYHTPRVSTIQNWVAHVPEDFLFSIKASRYITHRKRLHDPAETLPFFFGNIKNFGKKAGPILFQLPPSLKMDRERLIEFLKHMEKDYRYVFEFRDDSWFVDEIDQLLSEKNIALCLSDLHGKPSPEVFTANFTYMRLHGPKNAYEGSYGPTRLKKMGKKMETWAKKIAVYCYFDNDEKGYAVQDAKALKNLIE